MADRRLGSKQVQWSPHGLKAGWGKRHIQAVCYRVEDETGEIIIEDRKEVETAYLNPRLLWALGIPGGESGLIFQLGEC